MINLKKIWTSVALSPECTINDNRPVLWFKFQTFETLQPTVQRSIP